MSNTKTTTGAVALKVLTALITCTYAGLATAGPASFEGTQLPLEAVSQLSVPGPDYDRLWVEDVKRDNEIAPRRIAVPNAVSVTPASHGTWERTPNGQLLWRLIVNAPGSRHLNLGFEDWKLPDSGEAWITSKDGRWVLNPITPADNINEDELWTAIVFSDSMIVEITVDEIDRQALIDATTLTKVNAGYRGFGTGDGTRGSSESCNIDVVCPLGDDWWDEIPSVGVYTVNGFLTCTGAMINNTDLDETPYFLTADHCGIGNNNDQSVVVYWNHQNSYCRTGSDSGGGGNGAFNQSTSGSTHLVSGGNSDYCLIRLNSDPNPNYEVSFSGWNRSSSTPSAGMGIHHPNTAEKRISSVENIYSTGPYWGINWDEGRTYFGSSGSPLYDGNHRIVGQLYGGNSFCTNDQDDVYGKLSNSWSALSQYLDPQSSGATFVDTLNPYGDGGNGGVCCLLGNCYNVAESTCNSSNGTWYVDETCGEVDCETPPDPTGACCLDDGSCNSDVTNQECNASNGDWQEDTACTDANCPQPPPTGACCITSVTCSDDYTATECSSAGGAYQGDDTDCDFVDCDTGGGDLVELHHAIVGANLVSGNQDTWTVHVYAAVGAGNRVDAVAGNSVQEKVLTSTNGFYQDAAGGPTSADINPAFYEFVPDLEWDSRVTIGALDQTGDPFDDNNMGDVGIDWTNFENGGTLSVDNGTWYVLPTHPQGEAQAFISQDCSQQYGVLLARLTAYELDSTISMDALIQGRDVAGNNWQDTASYTFTYEATEDCNSNGVSDTCDIANGTSEDTDGNGIPDECDSSCPGDADGDGDSDVDDILLALGNYGGSGGGDVDGNGVIDVNDLLQILAYYGGC
ncbi:MAG: hypothetical protein VX527_08675 [Planctomycetota bacterium]|nr:hypothetical protein [Planctomycetota bacterium]